MRAEYDAVVIGAGHNGLVAAGYLAKSGLSVLILERSSRIGGACITKEIIKGFKISAAAQLLGMLRPQIVRDLNLGRHGLVYRAREPEVLHSVPGRPLVLHLWRWAPDRAKLGATVGPGWRGLPSV